MDFLSVFQDKATKAKTKIAKFLVNNKPFLNMIVFIMATAYKNLDGKEKMKNAIEALKITLTFTKLAFLTTYINPEELAEELEDNLQNAYDFMKEKKYID